MPSLKSKSKTVKTNRRIAGIQQRANPASTAPVDKSDFKNENESLTDDVIKSTESLQNGCQSLVVISSPFQISIKINTILVV